MTERILFVLPSFAGGGAERVIIALANSLDRQIYTPSMVVLEGNGPLASDVDDDIEVIAFIICIDIVHWDTVQAAHWYNVIFQLNFLEIIFKQFSEPRPRNSLQLIPILVITVTFFFLLMLFFEVFLK